MANDDDTADGGGRRRTPEPRGEKASEKKPEGEDKVEQEEVEEAARKRRRPLVISIGAIIVLLLIAGGLYNWLTTRNIESTDDAYTDSRAITIAPQVSGVVLSLAINDNQFVKKDQLLIHIDPRQYVNDRDQARACWRRRSPSMRGSSSAPKSRAGRGRAFSKTCRSFWMTGIQNAIH